MQNCSWLQEFQCASRTTDLCICEWARNWLLVVSSCHPLPLRKGAWADSSGGGWAVPAYRGLVLAFIHQTTYLYHTYWCDHDLSLSCLCAHAYFTTASQELGLPSSPSIHPSSICTGNRPRGPLAKLVLWRSALAAGVVVAAATHGAVSRGVRGCGLWRDWMQPAPGLGSSHRNGDVPASCEPSAVDEAPSPTITPSAGELARR